MNMPNDPILSTPTVKSSSMSNLAAAELLHSSATTGITNQLISVGRAQSEEHLTAETVHTSRLISFQEIQNVVDELAEYRWTEHETKFNELKLLIGNIQFIIVGMR